MKLDGDVAAWIDAATAWWLRELGPLGSALALPIDEHFPERTPEALFAAVLELGGMSDWSFELVDESAVRVDDPMANVPRPAVPNAILTPEDAGDEPLPEGGPYPIPYSREDVRDPSVLIATFARGVSHYLLASAAEEPPGGDEHHEAFVELGAVLMGFGVFLANSTFRFEQYEHGGLHGWSTSSHGALGEDALGYALALFVELTESDPKLALAHLAANPKASFKWARGQLERARRSTVEQLRAVIPASGEGGPYR